MMHESVPQGEDGLKPIPTSPCSFISLDAGDESPAYLFGTLFELVRGFIGRCRSRFPSGMTARRAKTRTGATSRLSEDESQAYHKATFRKSCITLCELGRVCVMEHSAAG